MNTFKSTRSFDERRKECEKVCVRYNGSVPVVVEPRSAHIPQLDRNKYIVHGSMLVSQFVHVLRTRLKLEAKDSLFVFCNYSIPIQTRSIASIHGAHGDPDGFLYLQYDMENTFG